MKKNVLIFILIITFGNISFSQEKSDNSDSLECDRLIKKAENLLDNHNYFVNPFLDSAYYIALEKNNKFQLSTINVYRGQSEYLLSNYQDAIKYYFIADSIIPKDWYPDLRSSIYMRIANIYVQNSLYEDAEKYLTKAKAILEKLGDKNHLIDIDFSTAMMLNKQGKDNAALELLKKCEHVSEDLKNNIHITGNIAVILCNQGKYEEALIYYTKSNESAKKFNDIYQMAVSCYNIGNIYREQKNDEKWYSYIQKALEYAEQGRNKEVLRDSYHDFYEYFQSKKNPQKALDNFLMFYSLDKELSGEVIKRDIELVNSRHKYKEAEEKIKIAEIQNDLKNSELSKKELRIQYLIIAVFIFMISFLVSLLLFLSRKKAYKKLVERNVKLLSVEEKIDRISKEDKEHIISEGSEDEAKMYKKIIDLIENKKIFLNLNLSQTSLAKELDIQVYKLSGVFSKFSESNYSDLINSYRIKHAQKLLSDPEKNKYSIAGVAQLSGYKSETTFYVCFKRITGVTPAYYRKNSQ